MSSKGFSLIEFTLYLSLISLLFTTGSLSFQALKKHNETALKTYYQQQLHSAKFLSSYTKTEHLIETGHHSPEYVGFNAEGRTKHAGTIKKNDTALVSLGIGIGKISIK